MMLSDRQIDLTVPPTGCPSRSQASFFEENLTRCSRKCYPTGSLSDVEAAQEDIEQSETKARTSCMNERVELLLHSADSHRLARFPLPLSPRARQKRCAIWHGMVPSTIDTETGYLISYRAEAIFKEWLHLRKYGRVNSGPAGDNMDCPQVPRKSSKSQTSRAAAAARRGAVGGPGPPRRYHATA